MFVIAEPRIDVTGEYLRYNWKNADVAVVEIPSDAKLPAILWKFHRRCKDILIRNPHFYPETPFKEEIITEIPPLRHRDEGKWTERVFVYGDSKEGRLKLISQDETIERLFGVVAQCLARPVALQLTIFKGLFPSWDNSLYLYSSYRYRGMYTGRRSSRSHIFARSGSQMLQVAGFFIRHGPYCEDSTGCR